MLRRNPPVSDARRLFVFAVFGVLIGAVADATGLNTPRCLSLRLAALLAAADSIFCRTDGPVESFLAPWRWLLGVLWNSWPEVDARAWSALTDRSLRLLVEPRLLICLDTCFIPEVKAVRFSGEFSKIDT